MQQQRMVQRFEAGKTAQPPNSATRAPQLLPGRRQKTQENSQTLKFSHAARIVISGSDLNLYLGAYG
jgi:hypothetical protein